jgi:DNA-binding MarR family transcriptional regulator
MKPEDIRLFRDTLRHLQRSLGWQAKHDADCCGVTIAQCHTLLEIGKKKELSLVDLSGMLGLDSSTLSRTIDAMVATKLVNRTANPEDRRYVTLSLTDKGQAICDRINLTFDQYYKTVFARIPADKQQQVMECISLLTRAVIDSEGVSCWEEVTNIDQ